MIAYKLFRGGSAIRVLVVIVLAFAAARAVLFNERLAVIELLVPLAYLLASPRKVTVPRVVVYAVVFLLAAITLFSVTELRRTYVYTNDFSIGRSTTRFFGYYLTSVNNGIAVIDDYRRRRRSTRAASCSGSSRGARDLHVEHFPVVGTISLRYVDAFGVDPGFWPRAFADQDLDYEFNVFTAPGFLAADFGWAALLAVLLIGLASGYLYRRGATSTFHHALYAVWLVGLFEFMRILYFTNTRMFPAYLVFLGVPYLVLRRRARAHARACALRRVPSADSLGRARKARTNSTIATTQLSRAPVTRLGPPRTRSSQPKTSESTAPAARSRKTSRVCPRAESAAMATVESARTE